MVTGCPTLLCAVAQVACHVPSFSEWRASGSSPLEKLTLTFPTVCGLPQSSTDCTERASGQPAGTAKAWLKLVSAGISLVGAHGGGAVLGRRSPVLEPAAPGVAAITFTLSVWTRPS